MENVRVTIGLPLPKFHQYGTDVSGDTRKALDALRVYSAKKGVDTMELREHSLHVAHSHNQLVNRMEGDWLLVCGSDHTFTPDALCALLDATKKEPFPKIIGGTTVFRNYPHRIVAANYDEFKQRTHHLKPFIDFDPGQTMAGDVIPVDVIGSGFCLYHRSVFEKIPFPWFQYAPRGIPEPMLKKIIDPDRFKEMAELVELGGVSNAKIHDFLRALEVETRAAEAKSWEPTCLGPDYFFCQRAGDYGIQSYLHFGVVVYHFDWFAYHPGHYIQYLNANDDNLRSEAGHGMDATVADTQAIRERVKMMKAEQQKTQEAMAQREEVAMQAKAREGAA